jgi:hypothetical protein
MVLTRSESNPYAHMLRVVRHWMLATVAAVAFFSPVLLIALTTCGCGTPSIVSAALASIVAIGALASGRWSWPGARLFLFALSFATACVYVACGNFLDPLGATFAFTCLWGTAGVAFVPTLAAAVRGASRDTSGELGAGRVVGSTLRFWAMVVLIFLPFTLVLAYATIGTGRGPVGLEVVDLLGVGVLAVLATGRKTRQTEFAPVAITDLLLGSVGLYASVTCLT